MRLYSLVDLTGNVNMIEKLVLGGTGTGDLPILSPTRECSSIGPHVGPSLYIINVVVQNSNHFTLGGLFKRDLYIV